VLKYWWIRYYLPNNQANHVYTNLRGTAVKHHFKHETILFTFEQRSFKVGLCYQIIYYSSTQRVAWRVTEYFVYNTQVNNTVINLQYYISAYVIMHELHFTYW